MIVVIYDGKMGAISLRSCGRNVYSRLDGSQAYLRGEGIVILGGHRIIGKRIFLHHT